MPEVAPELAVGHHRQAERLLPRHRAADVTIFDLAQVRGRDGAGPGRHARRAQLGWSQETADLLGAERWRHAHFPLSRAACTMHEMPIRVMAALLLIVTGVAQAAAPTLPSTEWMLEQISLVSASENDRRRHR